MCLYKRFKSLQTSLWAVGASLGAVTWHRAGTARAQQGPGTTGQAHSVVTTGGPPLLLSSHLTPKSSWTYGLSGPSDPTSFSSWMTRGVALTGLWPLRVVILHSLTLAQAPPRPHLAAPPGGPVCTPRVHKPTARPGCGASVTLRPATDAASPGLRAHCVHRPTGPQAGSEAGKTRQGHRGRCGNSL